MRLNLEKPMEKMIMCRFSEYTFKELGKLAKSNKTSRGKVIRALIEKQIGAAIITPSQLPTRE